MITPQLFNDFVRPCPGCDIPYDIRLHAPHSLPCSHTFCLMCLSKHEQRRKKVCTICKTKYSKFAPNLALMEVSQRLNERSQFVSTDSRQCDDCDNRVTRRMLRRCHTCEKQLVTRTEFKLECIICLECCVNIHNGHELHHVEQSSTPQESSPLAIPRRRHPSTSSTVSVQFRQPSAVTGRLSTKGIINTIKSWSFRPSNNEIPFMLSSPSKMAFSEEDIVMQCNSPFFRNRSPDDSLRHQVIPTHFLRYDAKSNADNTSVDSVFVESPQCISNPTTSTIPETTSLNQLSSSTTSLFLSSPMMSSKIRTIQNCFGTTRGMRATRIRMGVTDIVNTPRCVPESSSLASTTGQTMKSTRSENSVFPPTPPPTFQYI